MPGLIFKRPDGSCRLVCVSLRQFIVRKSVRVLQYSVICRTVQEMDIGLCDRAFVT